MRYNILINWKEFLLIDEVLTSHLLEGILSVNEVVINQKESLLANEYVLPH
jgi:hypothetical protein